jgi:hypothetical protein
VPLLIQALHAIDQLKATPEWSESRKPWLETKRQDILTAIRDCAGIAIDVAASASTIVPGSELPISVTVVNRSDYPFRLSMVASLYANPSKAPGTPLENNKPVKTDLVLKLPDQYGYTEPYWLEQPPSRGLYKASHQLLIGRPENYPTLPVNVSLDDAQMNTLIFTVPAVYRWTDPVKGEQVREVSVVPPVSVKLGSNVYIFPDAKPRPVSVWMRSFAPIEGYAWLQMPAGWKVEPQTQPVKFNGKDEEAHVTFTVTPPAGEDTAVIGAAVATADGKLSLTQGVVEIDYPHIPAQRILGDANAKVVRADIKRRGNRIGYVMGSGDDVPNILRQVGYDVTLLTDADLDRGDFSAFDAVITGIRAYNTRKRLKQAHEKLMKYVENGGTMVVQYNTTGDLVLDAPGPRPFKISRDRVTVEEAPVKLLAPDHPLLTAPNKITTADFDGWVQERGLYFTNEWDPAYTTVLATNDPGEPEKPGAQLYTRHGKGTFIYTSLAWWRQLPAGVPGAIRAFVNLVSAK